MHQPAGRLSGAIVFLSILFQLSACGGSPGSSGASASDTSDATALAAPAPVAEVRVQVDGIKAIRLEWDPADGADAQFLEIEESSGDGGPTALPPIEFGAVVASHRVDVFLPLGHSTRYRIRSCNAAGCSESPWAVTPDLDSAMGYVKAVQPLSEDWFGHAVALSADGSRLAVASWVEDGTVGGIDPVQVPSAGFDAGAVEVYRRDGARWQREAVIKPPTPGWGDRFGTDLAWSDDGQVLIMGVPNEDGAGSGVGSDPSIKGAWDSGAAHIYERDSDGQWRHAAYLKADVATAYRQFGQHVAMSGDGLWAAVTERGSSAMRVHLFRRTGSGWEATSPLSPLGNRIDDVVGRRISLDRTGRTLAVGVSSDTEGGAGVDPAPGGDVTGSGSVYVFERNTIDAWTLSARIRADVLHANMRFGWATALSADGRRLVVGASPLGPSVFEGGAYVFERLDTGWVAGASLQPGVRSGARGFGFAVGMSHDGRTVAVSDIDEGGPGLGFDFTAGAGTGGGSVTVFVQGSGSGWQAFPPVHAPNDQPGLLFGWSLSLAGDGKSLAVGATGDRSGAPGIGGDNQDQTAPRSGAVHLY
jgi:trimeric autotransporter adhesin